jgi:serine/threonine protein kinase
MEYEFVMQSSVIQITVFCFLPWLAVRKLAPSMTLSASKACAQQPPPTCTPAVLWQTAQPRSMVSCADGGIGLFNYVPRETQNDIWAIGSTLHSVVEGHDAHDDDDHSSWGEMTLQELRSGTLSNASKLRRTLSSVMLSGGSTDLSMCNAAGSSCNSLSSLVPSEQAEQPSSQRSSPSRRATQGMSGGGAPAAQDSSSPTPVPAAPAIPAAIAATRSNEYCDFLERCFQMDPQKRASAADLMVHPLMRRAIRHVSSTGMMMN